MAEGASYPRPASGREAAWLDLLLPAGRPGYALLREQLRGLEIIGEGRWGTGDMVFGRRGQEIDRTEGMQPVASYGEVNASSGAEDFIITLSVHQPNDDEQVEFQIGVRDIDELPEEFIERSSWAYARWNPGEPCPATGTPVREVSLNSGRDLLLVISPARRVLWLHDSLDGTSTLMPVTNFYNELMLLKGIRDPQIALDHKRLFAHPDEFTDVDLRQSFIRYNLAFRKVSPERMVEAGPEPPKSRSFMERIGNLFRGGSD